MSAIPTITTVTTAVPAYSASQDDVKVAFTNLLPLEGRRRDVLMAIFDGTQVQRRYSVYPLEEIGRRVSLTDTTELYAQHAVKLGTDVARRCLDEAGLPATAIDLFITVSCTGVMIPSVDAHIINELGFRSDVRRLPITELGCVAGAAALARAQDFIRGFPKANVLVVAIELPSLSLQREDLSMDNLVSSALFGDGAAAVLLTGADRPGIRILETLCHIFPDSTRALGFDLRSDGFHTVLSREVPDIVGRKIAELVGTLTARAGLSPNHLSCFVLHPGGRRILDAVEAELGLARPSTQPSWDVLRDYGNQSSASVLFVLREWLKNRSPTPGAHGLLAAFGPGLSTEMLLLQWN